MSQFVRICPRCQTQNPEYEHICTSCGHFIAMESPVVVEEKKPEPEKTQEEATTTTDTLKQSANGSATTKPVTNKSSNPSIYLELQSGEKPVFTVKSGWIMGQAYPDSQAEIQISSNIEGSQFVHRCHCRFLYKDNNWYVQALDQKRYQGQFTNPTAVNDMSINPDKARQIKNGDILRLSGLHFQVRFIKTTATNKLQPERELVAIMLTDMYGYSKHMERNEATAYTKLLEHNRIIRSMIENYRGREIKTIGDAFLIVFRSAMDAVTCALMIQHAFVDYNLNQPEQDKILVRIGIHLGDVLITENDVFGDGVNVAARIEPLAEPGGICLSEPVLETVRKKVQLDVHKIESSNLKNIEIAPTIYKIDLTRCAIFSE